MRLKIYLMLSSLALVACLSPAAFAQQQQDQDEENVRGAFLTTRLTVSDSAITGNAQSGRTPARSRRRRPPARTQANKPSGTNSSGKTTTTTNPKVELNSGTGETNKTAASGPIGLGYTLFMRNAAGDAVRVDPARAFKNGDSVRISLESNTDGYLYIFHTENDSDPEMLYPDARLDEGNNYIEAHVPYEIPSGQEKEERLRWFTFYGKPATERVYIVVTREPLPGVPTEDELVKYCQANQAKCPWHPSAAAWAQLKAEASAQVKVSKSKDYGQKQTTGEREATVRGLGLARSAPEPSVIRMNASSNTGILVTAIDLVHK